MRSLERERGLVAALKESKSARAEEVALLIAKHTAELEQSALLFARGELESAALISSILAELRQDDLDDDDDTLAERDARLPMGRRKAVPPRPKLRARVRLQRELSVLRCDLKVMRAAIDESDSRETELLRCMSEMGAAHEEVLASNNQEVKRLEEKNFKLEAQVNKAEGAAVVCLVSMCACEQANE